MTTIYANAFHPWAPKTETEFENGACRYCDGRDALDQIDGFTVWRCAHGDWIMPRERELSAPYIKHEHTACPGFCPQHPLLTQAALAFRDLEDQGLTWGDIAEMDHRASLAAETPAQVAARKAAEAAAELKSTLRVREMEDKQKEARWAKLIQDGTRMPKPCDYASLFQARICARCLTAVPVGQTHCSAKAAPWKTSDGPKTERQQLVKAAARALAGEAPLPRPASHMVCGEELHGCRGHAKGTCIYIHPSEPQWQAACSGAQCFDRQTKNFHLAGEAPARPQVRDFRALAGDRLPPRGDGRPQSREGGRPPTHGRPPSREARNGEGRRF